MDSRNRDERSETLAILRSQGSQQEPFTTDEVAETLECSRQVAADHLAQLVDDGVLRTKEIDERNRVWWKPTGTGSSDAPDRTADHETAERRGDTERSGVVIVDEADDIAWIDGTTAAMFDIELENAVGRNRNEFVRSVLAERADASVVDIIETASDDGATSVDALEFELHERAGEPTAQIEYQSKPIDSGRYAGGRVEFFTDVTEQTRSGRTGHGESELDVIERVSNGFFGLDENWEFTYVSDQAEELLGRAESELIGRNVWDEFEEIVGSTFEAKYREAMETQEPVHFEEYYSPLEAWFEVDAYPSESGLSVYSRDVTERREREWKLERYERIVDNIPVGVYRNTPGPDGTFVEGNPELAAIFDADSVEELIGSPVSDLYPDPERRVEFSRRLERDGIVEDYELKQETLEGRPIWISVTAMKTVEDGEVYFDGIVQDVTERKKREQARKQYETVAESASDAILTIDAASIIRDVNPAVEDVFGYEPSELTGQPLTVLMPEDLAREHIESIQRYLDTGQRRLDWDYIELPGVRKDGTEITIAVSFSEYEHTGERFFAGIIRDVSERKERERELKRTKERFETVFEGSNDAIYINDPKTDEILHANAAGCELLGYTREELLELGPSDCHPDEFDKWLSFVDGVFETGSGWTDELTCKHKNGERIPAEISASKIRFDGRDCMLAIVRDISDRREHEAYLHRLYETTASTESLFEGKLAALLELGRERLGLDIGFLTQYDGDEFEVVEAIGDHADIRAGASGSLDGTYCEQVIEAGGSMIVLDAQTEGWTDEPAYGNYGLEAFLGIMVTVDGEQYGTLGLASETGRSEAFTDAQYTFIELIAEWIGYELEREQRERELEQYETLFEQSEDVNAVIDADGTITYVTPSSRHVLGYEADELVGEDVFEYIHPDDRDRINEYADVVDPDSNPMVEFRFEHADGSWIILEAMGRNLLHDENINGIVAYTRDVTERRERERYQRQLYEITASNEMTFEEKLEEVFELGRDRFDMDLGGMARIDPDRDLFEVERLSGDHEQLVPGARIELSETYCRVLTDEATTTGITDPEESGFEATKAYEEFGVKSYLGTKIELDGDFDRTLFFASTEPREEPFSEVERGFHDLVGQWVQYELERERHERYQQELYEITASNHVPFDEKIDRIIDLGRERFGLDIGLLTHDEGEKLRLMHANGPIDVDEGVTTISPDDGHYCRQSIGADEPIGVEDVVAEGWEDDPLYRGLGLSCYLGVEVTVGNDHYGTLCFADREARGQSFTAAQRTFLDLMGQWVSYELERELFEEALQALNESSRELIRSESKTEVSENVVEAATSTLDLPGVVVYRYDEDADALRLDEQSVDGGVMDETIAEFPVDHSSLVGHAFCDGEAHHYDDVHDSEHLRADPEAVAVRGGSFVPLGDHGVLVVGWSDAGTPDDRTRQLIEILAANAEAAYTRVDHERELEESRQQYSSIVENFPNGAIALVDEDLRYATVGGSPRDLADNPAEEIEGKPVEEVLEPELAAELVPRYRRALDGETSRFEHEIGDRIYEFRVIPVRDDSGEVFAATGMSQEVTTQVTYQRELEAKARKQEVIADLGQRALGTDDLDDLFDDAVELVAETLDTDYCKVLDLDADTEELRLRSGVGWEEGHVGSTTVGIDRDSQAGYTLLSDEPIVVEEMDAEERFAGPDLLIDHAVESGVSVVIGSPAEPWGVLGTHDSERREFSTDDALFVQSVANILATAIDRRRNQTELNSQREHLAALNNLNTVVRDINEALVDQSTREEIERAVCERLANSDSYRFAWIAEVDSRTGSVEPHVEAGVEGYLDEVDVSIDEGDPNGQGPTGRAARTKKTHVTNDALSESAFEPWRDAAEEYGFRSSAAIPIVYKDTLYGILGVYTDRIGAFADEERDVVAQLGEIIGHAIASIERKQALMSDDVVEIDIRMENVLDEIGYSGQMNGQISFDDAVQVEEGTFLQYGIATDDALDTVEALVDQLSHWEEVTVLSEEFGDARFELRLSEPPVVSAVADSGGYIDAAVIEDGTMHMSIHLPPTVDVRRIVTTIQKAYPTAEMMARQQVSRADSHRGIVETMTEELTDRQRAALEASFHAGFFDWPRESSGEEVAESLGVSAPTFHQHLRKAQQKLLDTILS